MIFNFDALNTSRFYEDDFPLLMPRWGYVASAFVLFIIGFFGFFLNLMVILLMFKDRQLWTPLNIILFNLVCSDFSVSVLGNPFTLISALFHRWVFGPTMCVLYGFFMALLGITSITTLTVISFERYLMVTRPLSARHLSRGGAGLSILFIWTYSLALTTPPLMGWGNYVNEAANISCSVNWHEQSMNTLTYILFLFAMGQIVPFAVITFSYVNIIRTLKQNSKRLGRVNRAEARATAMVFIMIVAFSVAWTPYSVFALMEQFATEGIISPGAGVIPALVAKSSICYNPLIYVGMNTQFRQSIKRIFGIHSKHGNSRLATKHVTSSPAHRMTSTNDLTINLNSSEFQSNSKKRDRKISVNDDISEVTNEQDQFVAKNFGLSTIPENKTTSDAERSENTIYDEDSSPKKYSVSDECFKPRNDDHSPILTLLDAERTVFTKMGTKPVEDSSVVMNIYGNQAYEGHLTDLVELNAKYEHHKTKKRNIKHSYSLDLHQPSKDQSDKKRKLSIEPKMDSFSPPKGLFKDNVIGKIFDHSSKGARDNFKSYIYGHDSEDDSFL